MKTKKKVGRPPKHGKPMKKIEARVEQDVFNKLHSKSNISGTVNKILKDFFKGDRT